MRQTRLSQRNDRRGCGGSRLGAVVNTSALRGIYVNEVVGRAEALWTVPRQQSSVSSQFAASGRAKDVPDDSEFTRGVLSREWVPGDRDGHKLDVFARSGALCDQDGRLAEESQGVHESKEVGNVIVSVGEAGHPLSLPPSGSVALISSVRFGSSVQLGEEAIDVADQIAR